MGKPCRASAASACATASAWVPALCTALLGANEMPGAPAAAAWALAMASACVHAAAWAAPGVVGGGVADRLVAVPTASVGAASALALAATFAGVVVAAMATPGTGVSTLAAIGSGLVSAFAASAESLSGVSVVVASASVRMRGRWRSACPLFRSPAAA